MVDSRGHQGQNDGIYGPDNFSAKIILECSEQLVIPLTKICKKSVETGEFPILWKEANIILVPKKAIERIL